MKVVKNIETSSLIKFYRQKTQQKKFQATPQIIRQNTGIILKS